MKHLRPCLTAQAAITPILTLCLFQGCAERSVAISAPPVIAPTPTSAPRVTTADLDGLCGATWTGTLTYLDYTSKAPTNIRSTFSLSRVPPTATASDASEAADASWAMNVGYNDEPHANSASTLILRDAGRILDDEIVIDRTDLPDRAGVRFVTERDGEDDNVPARIRHVYSITDHEFTLQKLIQFPKQTEFFERHIYRWTR